MQIPLACPHCRSERAAFEYKIEERRTDGAELYINKQIHLSAVMAQCQVCGRNVLVRGQANTAEFTKVFEVFPEPEPITAPANTPDDIASLFIQGASIRHLHFDAAGMAYRKALQRVVGNKAKDVNVEIENKKKGDLYKGIKAVLSEPFVAKILLDWALDLNERGKEAAHDTFTEEECAELHAFTEMLLTYLYTLPAMLEARRKAK